MLLNRLTLLKKEDEQSKKKIESTLKKTQSVLQMKEKNRQKNDYVRIWVLIAEIISKTKGRRRIAVPAEAERGNEGNPEEGDSPAEEGLREAEAKAERRTQVSEE